MAESDSLIRPQEAAGAAQRASSLGAFVLLRPAMDALAAGLGALLGYQYRFHLSGVPIPGGQVPSFQSYAEAIPVVVGLWVLTFLATGRYRIRRGQSFVDEILSSAGSVALFVILALALEGLYRGFPYSRLVLADASIAALGLFLVERAAIRVFQGALLRSGFGAVRVLVVGGGDAADLLIRRLRMFPEYGYQMVGQVVAPGQAGGTADPRLPVFPLESGLGRIVGRERVQLVVMAGTRDHAHLLEMARVCLEQGAEVKVVPDVLEIMTTAARTDEVAGLPLLGVRPNRLVGVSLWLKRAFDLLGTLVAGVVAAPVVGVCALAIVLTSPGSPFYGQERLGYRGRPFTLWKLRSMIPEAERATGPAMTAMDDDRRIPVGRLARRFSLDELPQLWNVLKGDMSLVGPRPERPFFAAKFEREVPRYRERLLARPGITGWAQVNDLRQGSGMEERVFYDLYYIENWSLAFDLKILLLTPWRILFHRHAY